MILVLHAGLLFTAFLIMLNGFLHGANKHQIEVVLSLILVALVVTAFASGGWATGLAAIALSFIYAGISRPLAAQTAARLLSTGDHDRGRYVGLPPKLIERLSKDLSAPLSVNELAASPSSRDLAKGRLFDYCELHPELESVLKQFGATRATLDDLYSRLRMGGAGQWAGGHYIAASALAYPETLRFLLQNRTTKASPSDQAYALIMYFERGMPLPDAPGLDLGPPA